MIKNIIVFGVALLTVFTSCKKSYQCDCNQSKSVTYKERKRSDAIAACEAKAKSSSGEECNIIN